MIHKTIENITVGINKLVLRHNSLQKTETVIEEIETQGTAVGTLIDPPPTFNRTTSLIFPWNKKSRALLNKFIACKIWIKYFHCRFALLEVREVWEDQSEWLQVDRRFTGTARNQHRPERNILLRSNVVRVYCSYTYHVILCYFTFIFDLELMTLEKGKNAGIRPLFWQNRRLGGGLIPAYHCRFMYSHTYEKYFHDCNLFSPKTRQPWLDMTI